MSSCSIKNRGPDKPLTLKDIERMAEILDQQEAAGPYYIQYGDDIYEYEVFCKTFYPGEVKE